MLVGLGWVLVFALVPFLAAAIPDKKSGTPPPAHLTGIVVGIPSGKGITATYINAGELQGVKKGMQFGVYRDGRLIAILEVASVLQKMCSVRILQIVEGSTLKVGDRVVLTKGDIRVSRSAKIRVPSGPDDLGPATGETPVPPPYLRAGGAPPGSRESQERMKQLEKRVEDLEKLLVVTLARIPQVPPDMLANPPMPPSPLAAAPSVREAMAPPKPESLPAKAAIKAPPEEEKEDFWRSYTPYDKVPEPELKTPDQRAEKIREEEGEWAWGTPYEGKRKVYRAELAVSLMENPDLDFQGGAKFVTRSNFVECADWELQVLDPDGAVVRSLKGTDKIPESVEWDGKDDASEKVKSGVFAYSFKATVKTGEAVSTNGEIPPRNPVLAEDREWKYGSVYDEGGVGDRPPTVKERQVKADWQSVLTNTGKVLFTIALLLLIL